ncbi:DUF3368 domain-containing protein [Candidatus Woesearchaeota archaeon]|nr:DUF3368 domain-containing protein [Candidatus Woesearchaeota archaeon]
MKFILDSTVLLYFAKLKILEKLIPAGELIIPASVYNEVVSEGKKRGKEDALFVEKLVADGLFKMARASDEAFLGSLLKIPALSYADSETLAIARELSAVAVIDETLSRMIAELHSIKFHGSVFMLFLLFRKKLIQQSDIKSYVDKMVELGWRCSTEFYASILDEIRKL